MARHVVKSSKKEIPEGLWAKCKKCEQIIYQKKLDENFRICPKCGYYFRLNAGERIDQLFEKGSFKELGANIVSIDSLKFPDYTKRLNSYGAHKDAVVTGEAMIGSHDVAVCVMDFEYMGGSMGSAVGEKIVRTVELAIDKNLPVIIVSASGGARMQEGILSLMQMGKTSAALALLAEKKLPYISILTDPTTGGVAASFAMLGDIIVAEPNALIGFAGPRVIEQTIRQKLPDGFQLSEFLLSHGIVDVISERKDLKATVIRLLDYLTAQA